MTYKYLFTGAIIAKESECSFLRCNELFYNLHAYRVTLWSNETGTEVSLLKTKDCTIVNEYIATNEATFGQSFLAEVASRCKPNYLDVLQMAVVHTALGAVDGRVEDFVLTVWQFSRTHPEASIDEIMGQALHRVLGSK